MELSRMMVVRVVVASGHGHQGARTGVWGAIVERVGRGFKGKFLIFGACHGRGNRIRFAIV
jgi:hypothetical protein